MKKIIFSLVLMLTTSISFAFTQAEIDNCKTRVTKAYISQCKYSSWYVDHFNTYYDINCQPGYDEALARCDVGKMWLYKAEGNTGGTIDYKYNELIKNSITATGLYGVGYTDIMELSIHATSGMPTLKHCYQPTFAAYKLETDYITLSPSCSPDPDANFQFQLSTSSTQIYYFYRIA